MNYLERISERQHLVPTLLAVMVCINLVCSFVWMALVDEQENSMVASSDKKTRRLWSSKMEETIVLLKEVWLNDRRNFLGIGRREEGQNDGSLTRSSRIFLGTLTLIVHILNDALPSDHSRRTRDVYGID